MDTHLIPGVLPFTEGELRNAAHRWLPAEEAESAVAHIVTCAQDSVQRQRERSEEMERLGRAPLPVHLDIDIPEPLFAYLTLVSDSAAERVAAMKREEWERQREREVAYERRRVAIRAGLIPSMDDILDEAERRGDFSWNDPRVFRGLVTTGLEIPEPPPATPQVIATAEAHIAEVIARWEALVAAVRAGAALPEPEPRVIWDGDEAMPESELPSALPDWAFIDDCIDREDRQRNGERHLFGGLARGVARFNGELARALRVSPERAVPRVVMFHLIEGHNGALSTASPVGAAFASALGDNAPVKRTRQSGEFFEPADMLEWLETNANRFERLPLLDDWRARARTRREIAFMRLVRDRFDELFPRSRES
jgi:hypothetical protein